MDINQLFIDNIKNDGTEKLYAEITLSNNPDIPSEIIGQDELLDDKNIHSGMVYTGVKFICYPKNNQIESEYAYKDGEVNKLTIRLNILTSQRIGNTTYWTVPEESLSRFDIYRMISGIDGRVN